MTVTPMRKKGYTHFISINKFYSPMIELLSTPNAQIQGGPLGIVNLQKLQLLEKYFGKKLTVAKLDCLFSFSSSKLNTCTVPWSEVTHKLVLV